MFLPSLQFIKLALCRSALCRRSSGHSFVLNNVFYTPSVLKYMTLGEAFFAKSLFPECMPTVTLGEHFRVSCSVWAQHTPRTLEDK
jgi:hypothetical protein